MSQKDLEDILNGDSKLPAVCTPELKDACLSVTDYVKKKVITFYKNSFCYIDEIEILPGGVEMGTIKYNGKEVIGTLNYKNGTLVEKK